MFEGSVHQAKQGRFVLSSVTIGTAKSITRPMIRQRLVLIVPIVAFVPCRAICENLQRMNAKTFVTLPMIFESRHVTSLLIVLLASWCHGQEAVVTLGLPSAKIIAHTPSAQPPTGLDNQVSALFQSFNSDLSAVAEDHAMRDGNTHNGVIYAPRPTQSVSIASALPIHSESSAGTRTGSPPQAQKPDETDMSATRLSNGQSVQIPRWMSKTPLEPQLVPLRWANDPFAVGQKGQPDSLAAILSSQNATELNLAIDREGTTIRTHQPVAEGRPLTEIRRAAMRQRANRLAETRSVQTQIEPFRAGYGVETLRKSAMELIAEAQLKLDIRAYLTAEERARKALELIAQSIDTREQSLTATRDLAIALTAIREAEDFVGKYGLTSGETIARMVRSHSTEVLKSYDASNLSGLAAADIYLDWACRCVAPIAIADPLAAEAIRILAMSHRMRDNVTPFGIATSVHLIRTAAEGVPGNRRVQLEYEKTLQVAQLSEQESNLLSPGMVQQGNAGALVSYGGSKSNPYQACR